MNKNDGSRIKAFQYVTLESGRNTGKAGWTVMMAEILIKKDVSLEDPSNSITGYAVATRRI